MALTTLPCATALACDKLFLSPWDTTEQIQIRTTFATVVSYLREIRRIPEISSTADHAQDYSVAVDMGASPYVIRRGQFHGVLCASQ
jgi:hypothetical protein